ncbi:hypothetical protein [Endozoicomonas arenosclerae]|uniref:hypothetical protein n=1 Tax=Endozoicomonas arenosclerae TaxID=1633495 RepID=UPI0015606D29|nr:hypothetical protein [Endozoicomonas arenosclerae]
MIYQQAKAGTGWSVTIENQSSEDLLIEFAGNDNWYCNDFCGPSRIGASQSKTFYTEEKERTVNNAAIQGINLNGTHIEMYQGGHTHTGQELAQVQIFKDTRVGVCDEMTEAGISASHPNAVSISWFNAGGHHSCQGFFGTVSLTLIYKGKNQQ